MLTIRSTIPGWRQIEVHAVHVPPFTGRFEGAKVGVRKVATFEAIYRLMSRRPSIPTVLCGDFNSPESETRNGPIPFNTGGKRQIDAENAVLVGLGAFGLTDIYKGVHGTAVGAWSYIDKQAGVERRRRFDHVFASEELVGRQCQYLAEWQTTNLSDHAPIEVDFDLLRP